MLHTVLTYCVAQLSLDSSDRTQECERDWIAEKTNVEEKCFSIYRQEEIFIALATPLHPSKPLRYLLKLSAGSCPQSEIATKRLKDEAFGTEINVY